VIPAMLRRDPVVAGVLDETRISEERTGVRQGWPDRRQTGELPASRESFGNTETASMPVDFRFYLPECWVADRKRRKKRGVPDSSSFWPVAFSAHC
jgi:hypothetical protein